MQVDRYTKMVLTIIAGALVVIAAENAMKQAQAQAPGQTQTQAQAQAPTPTGVTKVAICNEDGSLCTKVGEYWDKSVRLLVMPPQ